MSLTKEIQQTICKAEIQKGNLVAENFNYFFAGELDVVSVNGNCYVSEFEIKVSRSDFKADAKKRKWNLYDNPYKGTSFNHVPNYFTYVCPPGLIKEEDLKPYMGLIYVSGEEITIIRKPKAIHRFKENTIKLITKLCRVNNWRHYFGAQKLTILNKEAKERNDARAQERLKDSFKHMPHRVCFKSCHTNERCECRIRISNQIQPTAQPNG